MSLILDALRRSEAERLRGRAPGLFVQQDAPVFRRRARTPAWVFVLGAALVLVLALFAWREWSRGDTDAVVTADSAETAAVDGASPAPVQATEASAAAADAPLPAITAAEGDRIVTVDADDRRRDAAPVTTAEPAPPAIVPAPEAVSPTPTPAASTGAAPAPAPATAPAPTPISAPASAPAISSPATPADAAPAAPAAPSVPDADDDADDDADPLLPTLAHLPAAERAALPALKVSMHVYNADRARRFIVVDGQRATEGALLAPGIVVESIHRDGAVLSVNGRRLRLQRP